VQNLCACLATGGMPVKVCRFGYRCDSCELEALDYHGQSRCVVMLRYCLSLGAFCVNQPFWLSLSCYKLACHYFLHLLSTLCTHTCPIFCTLLLCSTAQEMRSTLMKTSSRHAKLPVICLWQDGVISTA
jgi:hypothetical protein